MKVLIVHTSVPESVGTSRRADEFDLDPAARGIAEVLPEATVVRVRGEPREIQLSSTTILCARTWRQWPGCERAYPARP
jgi:hypothetical protein